jgi:RNA polymerase sigma-70 factor (ECF subfamily)
VNEDAGGDYVPHPRLPGKDDLDRLLGAVARGEHGAFDLVYEQLSGPVYSVIRTVVRDPGQAEEVAQEVLLEIWRTSVRYDPGKGSAAAWALTIARRRAIDRVRSSAAASERERRTVLAAAPWDHVGDAVAEAAGRERLRRCLDGLTDLQREAIMLAFYSGHTYAEVASILGIPAGTAKARIRDALIKLRDSMQPGPAAR